MENNEHDEDGMLKFNSDSICKNTLKDFHVPARGLYTTLPRCLEPQSSVEDILRDLDKVKAYTAIKAESCAPGRDDFTIFMPEDLHDNDNYK